jgi:RNA polymerase-binding protein DksA
VKKAAAKKTASGRTKAASGGRSVATGEKAVAEGVTAGKASPVKKAAAKKTVVKKAPAKKVTTKKAVAGGSRAAAGKPAAGKSTAKEVGAAQAAEQTGATTVVAKKTPGTATAAKTAVPKARGAAAEPGDLAVRPGEDPWTPEEVTEARAGLQSEQERLETEISESERSLAGLMRDSGDGAGDDQADTGTKNITREHELALTANAREMLIQTEHALERLDAGTYGLCENCGKPIGKARMQAFPRATLCVECKQKQERRY